MCACVSHASEKLLSDTAVPLFPSYTPSLAQLPLTARSHDPPMLLPAFTFSSAWLASERQRPAPSPTPAFSIVHCWQACKYVTKTMASHRGFGPKLSKTNCSEEKRSSCFPLFPSSFSPLSLLSWLIVWLRPTRKDSLKQAESHCSKKRHRRTWITVTVCWAKYQSCQWMDSRLAPAASHSPSFQKQTDFWSFSSKTSHFNSS